MYKYIAIVCHPPSHQNKLEHSSISFDTDCTMYSNVAINENNPDCYDIIQNCG